LLRERALRAGISFPVSAPRPAERRREDFPNAPERLVTLDNVTLECRNLIDSSAAA
jgi:hypothetical protein